MMDLALSGGRRLGDKVQGNLVLIGGAEDKKGEKVILREVLDMAGGRSANILVMTAAARDREAIGEEYREVFRGLGAQVVRVLHIDSRAEAADPRNAAAIREATGVFFTGGDQLRITALLGGTEVYRELHEAYARGVVIAGTSAGASAMSDTMIIEGDGRDSPRNLAARMAPGMGLLEEVVIDQHFAQRGRLNRLLVAVAQNPYILGIGIDEDTALIVGPGGTARVIGSGTVTVVDGKSMSHTNVSEMDLEQPVALLDARLHVLPPGYAYDLGRRRPIVPE